MYTGTEKKAIVIKNTDNSIFEAAYFILKDDFSDIKETEMVKEANRILKNNLIGGYFYPQLQKNQPKQRQKGQLYFWLGAFVSAVVCVILFMMMS